MNWRGIGRAPGEYEESQASVQAVFRRRAGFPVHARERTVSREPAARSFSTTTGFVSASRTVSQMDPVQTPSAPRAMRRGHLSPAADAAGGQDRHRPDSFNHFGNEDHRRDFSRVPAGLRALRDDDIDAGRDLRLRLMGAADERRDEDAGSMRLVDYRRRWCAESVRDELDGVLERDVHLSLSLLVRPGEQPFRLRLVRGQWWDAMPVEH